LDEILRALLASPEGVSGEALSATLRITRAAVWKRIERLRAQGFDIRGAGRGGYRLVPPEDPLHPVYWRDRLRAAWAGRECVYHQSLPSTNAEAKRMAIAGAPHGQLVLAEEQTAGRGRRGRDWASPPGAGLWMSLVLRPQVPAERVPSLALAIALAVAEACDAVSGRAALTFGLKWPNDVLAGGRKVCGILLEMAADMDGAQWVVAGVGVNVRQAERDFPPELAGGAASLAMVAESAPRRADLLTALLDALETRYAAWSAGGVDALRAEYARRSVTLGRRVRVEAPDGAFTGQAQDIDDTGALLVRRDGDGQPRRVLAADVSVRGVLGDAESI
jgi:BirA family biotin operon repressor/biotin-[acetyl-CoA-carboxylase] ligase